MCVAYLVVYVYRVSCFDAYDQLLFVFVMPQSSLRGHRLRTAKSHNITSVEVFLQRDI